MLLLSCNLLLGRARSAAGPAQAGARMSATQGSTRASRSSDQEERSQVRIPAGLRRHRSNDAGGGGDEGVGETRSILAGTRSHLEAGWSQGSAAGLSAHGTLDGMWTVPASVKKTKERKEMKGTDNTTTSGTTTKTQRLQYLMNLGFLLR